RARINNALHFEAILTCSRITMPARKKFHSRRIFSQQPVLPMRRDHEGAATPLLQRRGGCASSRWREATLDAQTGWSEMFLTNPSAPIKGCLRRYFLRSCPPLLQRRGITAALRVHLKQEFQTELDLPRIEGGSKTQRIGRSDITSPLHTVTWKRCVAD